MPLTPTERKHYNRLLGKKIVSLAVAEDEDIGTVPGFVLDDDTEVLVFADPEGNGPGFLEINRK